MDDLNEKKERQRTNLQNKSLHRFLRELASALNDSGTEMHVAFKDIEIPWNEYILKSFWKKIESIHTEGKISTTAMTTKECIEIYEIVNRHFSQFGVSVPWPSIEEILMKQRIKEDIKNNEYSRHH